MDPVILTVFIVYMLVVVGVGIYAARRTAGVEGFFLADRSLGSWVVGLSAAASSESGWLTLGCVGMGFVEGLSAIWIAVGCLLGFCFNWFVVAERLRRRSRELSAVTVPDYLEAAVEDHSGAVRAIAVLIILLLMFTYVAAQLTAMGKAFDAMLGVPYLWGVLLGAAVTIIYTTAGGFRAVSWTDVLQGLMMVGALSLLPLLVIFGELGGPARFWARLGAQEEAVAVNLEVRWPGGRERVQLREGELVLDPASRPPLRLREPGEAGPAVLSLGREQGGVACHFVVRERGAARIVRGEGAAQPAPKQGTLGEGEALVLGGVKISVIGTAELKGGGELASLTGRRGRLAFLGFLLGMLGIGLGYPGTPHVITRFMATRDSKEIRRGRAIALTWGALSLSGAIFLGIGVRCLMPELTDPEYGILAISRRFLPPLYAGLVLAAVVSAVRSTIDSQLLVAASAVARDAYQKLFGRELSEERMVALSRAVVVVLGVAAVGLAAMRARVVFWFVLFSWAGLGAAFGPAIVLSLCWKRLTRGGVIAAMVGGLATVFLWKLWLRGAIASATGVDIYELVPAFFVALGAAVLFSLGGRQREEQAPASR